MATVFVFLESAADTPLTGASPLLDFWDKSTPAAPTTGVAMTELTGGIGGAYFVDVATVDGREFAGIVDGTAATKTGGRFHFVTFSGETDARIETDVPAILADTDSLDTTKITTPRADNLDEITAIRLAELDAANLPADVDTLLARLTVGRAANLDEITPARLAELDPANLPADIDTLLARLTASRAANLDEITAARLAELDPANMPGDIDTLLAGVALVLSTGGAGPWTSASASEADRVEVAVISTSSSPGTVKIVSALYRNGVQVTSGITGGTVIVKVPGSPGSTLIPLTAMAVGDDSVLFLEVPAIVLADATNYYAVAAITDGSGTVTSIDFNPTI